MNNTIWGELALVSSHFISDLFLNESIIRQENDKHTC